MEKEFEIIRINLENGLVSKKLMKESDWLQFHKTSRQKGFKYICYQKGFSQFEITEENNSENIF